MLQLKLHVAGPGMWLSAPWSTQYVTAAACLVFMFLMYQTEF
jgi:hypothetical protein